MIAPLAVAALGLALLLGAPWWLCGALALPALLWAPGAGWARRLAREAPPGPLQLGLDAAWLSLGQVWVGVALVRELGLRGGAAQVGLLGLLFASALVGGALGRGRPAGRGRPGEALGAALVAAVVLGVGAWRSADLTRPLDAYWYLEGAADEGSPPFRLEAGPGFSAARPVGWPEAHALALTPVGGSASLIAPDGATGELVLVVRGPLGSRVRVGEAENTVQAWMKEASDPRGDRRYLRDGAAAVRVPVDLPPGGTLAVEVYGATLYALPGAEAVWAAHADGELRYIDRWQILNQVENQVWAEELLESRWFTWNQPPGWSPVLAAFVLLVRPDLPAAGVLFLGVIALVGLQAVRLSALLAPGAPSPAVAVPAALVGAHGLLMLEPASHNFPDSLFAASVLAVGGALAAGRSGWLAGLGGAAQALRWPGLVLTLLLGAGFALARGARPLRGLGGAVAVVAAGGLIALIAALTGHADDLLFVLYFETFPEHWHDNYEPVELMSRVPGFYLLWLRYTGGGLAVAVLGALLLPAGPARAGVRAVLLPALAYSALLCTIDHHPTHYFLPLVALTGPAVGATCAGLPGRAGAAVGLGVLAGVGALLAQGQVW